MRPARSWYEFDYVIDYFSANLGPSRHSDPSNEACEKSGEDRCIEARAREESSRGVRAHVPPRFARGTVTAGKTSRAYNAHSYPTKIPPEAIEPYIEHFTAPGDVVLDPFCGSGMTGLAAQRRGRRAVLNDLSPLAVHLAFNHTAPCDPGALLHTWRTLRRDLAADEARHYGIRCDECRRQGTLRYTIWSDVYRCPSCRTHTTLWHDGIDRLRGQVPKELVCGACSERWPRTAATRVRVEPAWVAYSCECHSGLRQRRPSATEIRRAVHFPPPRSDLFAPADVVQSEREMYQRSALHLRDIRTVADLYTPRNLSALASLWHAIASVRDGRVRHALAFAFTNTAWHGTRMRRFNARGGHRPLTGTLFVPQLSAEANVFEVFDHKIRQLTRFYAEHANGRQAALLPNTALHVGSATDLRWVPDASIDYVFTDPPFGSNIFYGDCNLVSEAWLGTTADTTLEAVVNRSRRAHQGGKSLDDYQLILASAFAEMRRVLKPGRWATVVFQSSDGAVWHAIERAAVDAGFEVHSADMLDKIQQSMKGYKGRSGKENVASFDIVLHLRKATMLSAASAPAYRSNGNVDENSQRLTKVRMNGQGSGGNTELAFRSSAVPPPNADRQSDIVRRVVAQHLAQLPRSTAAERTLPYLYSLSVRALLNEGESLAGFSMDSLRAELVRDFEERRGKWYTVARRPAVEASVRTDEDALVTAG